KEGSIKTRAASTVKKRTKARDLVFLCIDLFAFMIWPLHVPSLELGLKCCAATLSRANPQGLFDIGDKNLTVTNLACACRFYDRVNDFIHEAGGNRNLDFRLWNEAHLIFGAAIKLPMPFLEPETLNLGYGHASDTGFFQRILHLFEPEWLDDSDDELHKSLLRSGKSQD